jgi:hypothetical protein
MTLHLSMSPQPPDVDKLIAAFGAGRKYAYSRASIPSQLDTVVEAFIAQFCAATEPQREHARARLFPSHSSVFLAYAERMAVLAVRRSNAEPLRQALLALAVEDFRGDYRETLITFSLVVHSASKLNVDLHSVGDEVSKYSSSDGAGRTRRFLESPSSIASMGYMEGSSAEGFCYKRDRKRR